MPDPTGTLLIDWLIATDGIPDLKLMFATSNLSLFLTPDDNQVTLELIGDGRSLEDFKAMAARLGLSGEAFRSHGFVEYRKALGMVSRADAGLIPHFASESWESTIPNKLFDYMSLAVPVISSDVTPVKRVLDGSTTLDEVSRVVDLTEKLS